ncbi:MAG: hypothetical protein ACPGNT_09270, partial [Rhodospirillales bacterium]
MMRVLLFAIVLSLGTFAGAPQVAHALSADDARWAREAFTAAELKRWQKVERARDAIQDPLLRRLFDWMLLSRPDTEANFQAIQTFTQAHPNWPRQSWLTRRAEEKLAENRHPAETVLAFFGASEPISAPGMGILGEALLSTGQVERGGALIRQGWIEGNFTRDDAKAYLARYRTHLDKESHWQRLDRLVWDGRSGPARQMMGLVDSGHRYLAEARILLRQRHGNVDAAIARIPPALQNDPGLVYERVRWRRIKGRDEDARNLIKTPDAAQPSAAQPSAVQPNVPALREDDLELWWAERHILARRALQAGHITAAYRLASGHGLKSGAAFAQGEWLAGWLALRYLDEPATAFLHFKTLFDGVSYPISLSRAAYWAGRAAEAGGKADIAQEWFKRAASWPTTYYGQLAHAIVHPGRGLALPAEPETAAEDRKRFEAHELTRLLRLLAKLDQDVWLRAFLEALAGVEDSPAWAALTAGLAKDLDRPDLAVRLDHPAGLLRALSGRGHGGDLPVVDDHVALKGGRPRT